MALTNNDILKKLRVALKMRDDDIIEVLSKVNFKISKSELGAFFRSEDHPKFMELQDQILRNFLNGLIIYKRGPRESKSNMPQNEARRIVNNPIKAQKKREDRKKGDE